MKQFNKKWIFSTAGVIAVAWILLFAFTSAAASDKVKDAKDNVNKTKEDLEKSQQTVTEMESAKAQLEGKMAELNKELSTVSSQLETAQAKLADKKRTIAETKEQLAIAEANEEEQYISMKKRIKYMYENGNTDMIQMILESENFTDVLNKAEFFRKMTEYDRNMLEEYSATKNTIANSKAILEEEEKELEQVVADVEAKKKQINHLVNQTSEEIAKQESNLADAEAKALAYEKQLQEQQNTLKALEEKEAEEKRILAEQEKIKKAAAAKNSGAGVNTVLSSGNTNTSSNSSNNTPTSSDGYGEASSSSELKLLATIIYCEAGNQPYEGKIAVGSVIMNRINSSLFPNTLLGVLYQKSQFTPVMSGRFAIALTKNSATDSCYSAAREVLNGTNNVPDCLFFRTIIPDRDGIIIGGHVFY